MVQISQNLWLSVWSDATVAAEAAGTRAGSGTYLAVYMCLSVALLAANFGSGVFITIGTVSGARTLYDDLVTKVHNSALGRAAGKTPSP